MSYLGVDNLEVGGFSKHLPFRKSPNTSIGTTKRLEVGSFQVVAVVPGVLKDPGSSHCPALSSPAAGFWPQTQHCDSCCGATYHVITGYWSKKEGRGTSKGLSPCEALCILLVKWTPWLLLTFHWVMCPFWTNRCWRGMDYCSHVRWIIIYLLGLEENPLSKIKGFLPRKLSPKSRLVRVLCFVKNMGGSQIAQGSLGRECSSDKVLVKSMRSSHNIDCP